MAKRGASQSGMASLKRKKDQEMAHYLKQRGVTRTHCNCPICHARVPLPFNDWNRHRCR